LSHWRVYIEYSKSPAKCKDIFRAAFPLSSRICDKNLQ